MLAQVATDAKSNESTAVPALLRLVSLQSTIVTADALHDDVVCFLDDPASKAITAKPMVDAGHGQVERRRSPGIETRTATVPTDIGWLQKQHEWPGLAAIGKVRRIRETATATTAETAYYLLSTALSPDCLNEVARSHRGIENQLHWRLDVVMNEDGDRTRLGHGPENLAALRHMALNVIQAEPSKGSLRGKLKRAGWDEAYLTQLLKLFEVR